MKADTVRRRDFIATLGAAATLPGLAWGQHRDSVRCIGVIMNLAENDSESVVRIAAFRRGLQDLGWTEGHNLRIDFRWGPGDVKIYRHYAEELVALGPDVIVAAGVAIREVQRATRTVPIVFTSSIDPIALGYVETLARPGGNTTGLINFEYRFSGK